MYRVIDRLFPRTLSYSINISQHFLSPPEIFLFVTNNEDRNEITQIRAESYPLPTNETQFNCPTKIVPSSYSQEITSNFPISFDPSIIVPILLDIKPDLVLNIYQWGSKLFGNDEQSSDVDLMVIISDTVLVSQDTYISPYLGVVKTFMYNNISIDIVLYKESHWRRILKAHEIWAIIFYFIPEKFIYKQSVNFPFFFCRHSLFAAVLCDYTKNSTKATNFWSQTQSRRALKRLIYLLQHLTFAIQFAQTGSIYDITAGNFYHNEFIAKINSIDWDPIYTQFELLSYDLLVTLSQSCINSIATNWPTTNLEVPWECKEEITTLYLLRKNKNLYLKTLPEELFGYCIQFIIRYWFKYNLLFKEFAYQSEPTFWMKRRKFYKNYCDYKSASGRKYIGLDK